MMPPLNIITSSVYSSLRPFKFNRGDSSLSFILICNYIPCGSSLRSLVVSHSGEESVRARHGFFSLQSGSLTFLDKVKLSSN